MQNLGLAHTQITTNRNCALDFPTFEELQRSAIPKGNEIASP